MMYTKAILVSVVAIVLLAAFFMIASRRRDGRLPAGRLGRFIAQRPDYLIFVGVPFAKPTEWGVAAPQQEGCLEVKGHGIIRISDVRAFAVAYPNGQLLDAEPCGLPLPEGLTGLWPSERADSDVLRPEDLESGREYIQVTYGPSTARPKDRRHYATTLKNVSTEPIRITRFAGYKRKGKGWRLSNVTRQFYSATEFREWYAVGPTGWIEPGESVADPNNYGSPPVLWAYYCESASGKQFIAGGVLE